jgi:hypothetical protein
LLSTDDSITVFKAADNAQESATTTQVEPIDGMCRLYGSGTKNANIWLVATCQESCAYEVEFTGCIARCWNTYDAHAGDATSQLASICANELDPS